VGDFAVGGKSIQPENKKRGLQVNLAADYVDWESRNSLFADIVFPPGGTKAKELYARREAGLKTKTRITRI
jgi:hypothetical protein